MLVHCKENNITPGWTICFQREVDIHVLFRINIGKQGCRTWVGMEEVEGISAIDPHTIGPILRPCQTVISVVVTCAVYKVQFKLDWLSPPPPSHPSPAPATVRPDMRWTLSTHGRTVQLPKYQGSLTMRFVRFINTTYLFQVLMTNLAIETVSYREQANMWIGPREVSVLNCRHSSLSFSLLLVSLSRKYI